MWILQFEKVTKFSPCKIGIGINIHECQLNQEMAIVYLLNLFIFLKAELVAQVVPELGVKMAVEVRQLM